MSSIDVDEKQVGGNHYKTSFQHWDVLHRIGFGSEYYVGQATKYLTRWRKKHGIRDIRKGQHFLEKLIQLTKEYGPAFLKFHAFNEEELMNMIDMQCRRNLDMFFDANELDARERAIITGLFFSISVESLQAVWEEIDKFAIDVLSGAYGDVVGVPTDAPTSVRYEFIEYGEGHETITWRDKQSGEQLVLPVDVPPGFTGTV